MPDEIPNTEAAPKDDSAYKAELASLLAKDRVDSEVEVPKPEAPPEKEKKPEVAEDDSDDDEDVSEDDEDSDGDEEELEGKGKYSQALRKLRKEEASLHTFKAQILNQQKEFQAKEQKFHSDVQGFQQFVRELKVDPFRVLTAHGFITEDDAEYISKQLYFNSKSAAADPKNRAEAERLRRDRERDLDNKKALDAVEKMRQERDTERAEASQKAELDAYVGKISSAAAGHRAKSPELAKALDKFPEQTNQELIRIAHSLSEAKGELADSKLVVLAWVKHHKAETARYKELMAEAGEPVAVVDNKAKSTKPVEQKGAANGKTNAEKGTQSHSAEDSAARDALYKKQLAEMLKGQSA